jgi:hypothetical protein
VLDLGGEERDGSRGGRDTLELPTADGPVIRTGAHGDVEAELSGLTAGSGWTAGSVAAATLSAEPVAADPAAAAPTPGPSEFARALRLTLSQEHLGTELDPAATAAQTYAAFWRSASDTDAWHANGRRGPRPPGRLRHYHAPHLTRWQRAIARPLYRFVYDPDGRPHDMRRRGEF